MAYTRHGHHIPGTPKTGVLPTKVARCGGTRTCVSCSDDAKRVKEGL